MRIDSKEFNDMVIPILKVVIGGLLLILFLLILSYFGILDLAGGVWKNFSTIGH